MAFLAPSSTFRRCRPGPRGVPFRRPPRPKPRPTTLMTLASSSKRPLERWSHLSAGPPLMRFASPLHRHVLCASTPGSKLPSSRRCQASSMFRPRGFSPPRRFTPHTGSRVCCAPLPVWGSPRFGQPGAGPVRRRWRTSLRPPRDAGFTPYEEFPSSTAGTASLRPVALLTLPAWSDHQPRPKPKRGRSRRTGDRGASEEARWHQPTFPNQ